jgi:hypothetical protein
VRRAAIGALVAALLVAASGACEDDDQSACRIDTDCPAGTICREGLCGPVGADGGGAPLDARTGPCSNDGVACATADECCARTCVDGRCGVVVPPPPPPACRSSLELCQNDCCAGLSCVSGVCR